MGDLYTRLSWWERIQARLADLSYPGTKLASAHIPEAWRKAIEQDRRLRRPKPVPYAGDLIAGAFAPPSYRFPFLRRPLDNVVVPSDNPVLKMADRTAWRAGWAMENFGFWVQTAVSIAMAPADIAGGAARLGAIAKFTAKNRQLAGLARAATMRALALSTAEGGVTETSPEGQIASITRVLLRMRDEAVALTDGLRQDPGWGRAGGNLMTRQRRGEFVDAILKAIVEQAKKDGALPAELRVAPPPSTIAEIPVPRQRVPDFWLPVGEDEAVCWDAMTATQRSVIGHERTYVGALTPDRVLTYSGELLTKRLRIREVVPLVYEALKGARAKGGTLLAGAGVAMGVGTGLTAASGARAASSPTKTGTTSVVSGGVRAASPRKPGAMRGPRAATPAAGAHLLTGSGANLGRGSRSEPFRLQAGLGQSLPDVIRGHRAPTPAAGAHFLTGSGANLGRRSGSESFRLQAELGQSLPDAIRGHRASTPAAGAHFLTGSGANLGRRSGSESFRLQAELGRSLPDVIRGHRASTPAAGAHPITGPGANLGQGSRPESFRLQAELGRSLPDAIRGYRASTPAAGAHLITSPGANLGRGSRPESFRLQAELGRSLPDAIKGYRSPTPAAGSHLITHTIRAGDRVWNLSRPYGFDDPRAFTRLVAENNPGIDFRHLRVGQQVNVPVGGAVGGVMAHTIESGDRVWNLGPLYGFDNPSTFTRSVRQLNPGIDFRHLRVGQRINVPTSAISRPG